MPKVILPRCPACSEAKASVGIYRYTKEHSLCPNPKVNTNVTELLSSFTYFIFWPHRSLMLWSRDVRWGEQATSTKQSRIIAVASLSVVNCLVWSTLGFIVPQREFWSRLNPCPLHSSRVLNHWTTREVHGRHDFVSASNVHEVLTNLLASAAWPWFHFWSPAKPRNQLQ